MSERDDLAWFEEALSGATSANPGEANEPMPTEESWVAMLERLPADMGSEDANSLVMALGQAPLDAAVLYWEMCGKFPKEELSDVLRLLGERAEATKQAVSMPPAFVLLLSRFLAGDLVQRKGKAIPFDGKNSFARRWFAIKAFEKRRVAGDNYDALCADYAGKLQMPVNQFKDLITNSRKE
ncbi:MAG: hypothetical protein AAF160_01925 [Pseudomonadota bacterium]